MKTTNYKTFDLSPVRGQKSFYGKAKVIETWDATILKSYDTIVCSFDREGFHRHWDGYSATTMKHINAFLDVLNLDGGGKKWWTEKAVERFDWIGAISER